MTSFLQAQEANRAALRDYTWKSRTELTIDGESRQVRLDQVRYDFDGAPQRTRIGGSEPEAPRAPGLAGVIAPKALGVAGVIRQRAIARKAKDIRTQAQALSELASRYTHLSLDRLHAFTRLAITRPGSGPDTGLVLLHGTGVLQGDDAMSVWLDPSARPCGALRSRRRWPAAGPHRGRIPDLVERPFLPGADDATLPADNLVITVEQFDYQPAGGAR